MREGRVAKGIQCHKVSRSRTRGGEGRGGGIGIRPVARSGNGGVQKTNVDLTSGRWPRWVAQYEKGGGGAVNFRSDIRKVGGGGERCKLPHWGLGPSPRSFASRDPHHLSGP